MVLWKKMMSEPSPKHCRSVSDRTGQTNRDRWQTDCSQLPEFQLGEREVLVRKEQASSRYVRAKLESIVMY